MTAAAIPVHSVGDTETLLPTVSIFFCLPYVEYSVVYFRFGKSAEFTLFSKTQTNQTNTIIISRIVLSGIRWHLQKTKNILCGNMNRSQQKKFTTRESLHAAG